MNEIAIDWTGIATELGAKFAPDQERTRQGRGGTFTYVTARDVADRLDAVVGPGAWSTCFRVVDPADHAVECTLTIHGVARADVGYPNNPDDDREQEKLKAAYSDAFKRAAVQWGVGRYLYDQQRTTVTRFSAQAPPQQSGHLVDEAKRQGATPLNERLGTAPAPPRPPGTSAPAFPATEPQIKAVYAIGRAAQHMSDTEIDDRCQELYGVTPSGLSKRQASEFIDALKGGRG